MSEKEREIKPYPSSMEAESALLGCVIEGGEREQEISMAWIRDDDAFYNTDNKEIWTAMKSLYKDNIQI